MNTIAEEWKNVTKMFPSDMPHEQRESIKSGYYTGMAVLFDLMRELNRTLADSEDSQEVFSQQMSAWKKECQHHMHDKILDVLELMLGGPTGNSKQTNDIIKDLFAKAQKER